MSGEGNQRTRMRFVGTPLDLTERETYYLLKYWKKGRAARTIIPVEVRMETGGVHTFDLDVAALQTPVLLDCANCHLAHEESCCEGGFPFPPAEELLPMLDAHLPELAQTWLPQEVQEHIRSEGLYEQHVETAGFQTIGTFEGNCLFCRVEGQGPACVAHRHALNKGLQAEELKPLSCLLYPLDLIADEQGRVLVTALTQRTASFSRWGEEYRLDFLCGNRELRAAEAAGDDALLRPNIRRGLAAETFALDRYRPAWQEGQGLLTRLYGDGLWQQLEQIMGGTK
jgi:hypothetical protein